MQEILQFDLSAIPDFTEAVLAENARLSEMTGQSRLALVRTYGCQQNAADGERIKGVLSELGYGFTEQPEEAHLIIFNTCAVREHAEDRVFGNLGALKKLKNRRSSLIIAVCGCMAKQPHIAERIKKSFPYVDLVFGTNGIHRLPEYLYQVLTQRRKVCEIEERDSICEGMPVIRAEGGRALLSVMYGCDNFCSYCIVPYVRGRERSRRPEDILAEAKQIIAAGYHEILLLGQNVNSYGKGLAEPINFAELLRRINALPGDFRVKFMTSHPKDCTPELIDTIAECDKICNYLHLPVQSGSDRILTQMNRRYDREKYLSLIRYAKEKIPGISFSSDIIVGFPGETEEDFAQTLSLVEEVEYDSLFTFIYSKRKGTKAADLPDATPHSEKTERFARLLALQEQISIKRHQAFLGRKLRVIAEEEGKTGPGYLTGRSDENIICEFPGDPSLIGKPVWIVAREAKPFWMVGDRM